MTELDSFVLPVLIIAVPREAESKLFNASSRETIEPESKALEAHAASAFARYASTDV